MQTFSTTFEVLHNYVVKADDNGDKTYEDGGKRKETSD